jgi:hypothetical protein
MGPVVRSRRGSLGGTAVAGEVRIAGLEPNTTYHFRLVATNTDATTPGPDETFTTASATMCPNEALREESSINPATSQPYDLGLPDCRAYEQVTPQSKGGTQTTANAGPGGGATDIAGVASSGENILATTPAIWGQPPGYTPLEGDPGTPGEYELSRTANEWRVTPLNPPASRFVLADSRFAGEAEPGSGIWAAKTATQSENVGNLYVRADDSVLTNIGPIAPASVTAGAPGSNGNLGESLEESQVMGAWRRSSVNRA